MHGKQPSLVTLFRRYKHGDQEALNVLILRVHNPLSGMMRLKLRPPLGEADLEDVMQKTYLKFLKFRGDFHYDGQIFKYLTMTAFSVRADLYRKESRFQRSDLSHEMIESPDLEVEPPPGALRRLIDLLPGREHEVAELYFLDRLEPTVIMRFLQISESAVFSALRRAKLKLSSLIAEDEDFKWWDYN